MHIDTFSVQHTKHNTMMEEEEKPQQVDRKRKAHLSNRATSLLYTPSEYCVDYRPIPFNKDAPRPIPFPDGQFGEDPFIQISDNGTKITFTMQKGDVNKDENGTFPEAMILAAKAMIEEKNKAFPSREGSLVITKLDEALLWACKRQGDRELRSVQGKYTK